MSATRMCAGLIAGLILTGCYVAPQTIQNYVICTQSTEGLDRYESLLADYADERGFEVVKQPRHQFAHEENLDTGPLTYLLRGDDIVGISGRLQNSATEVLLGIEPEFNAPDGEKVFIERLEDDFRVIPLVGEGAYAGYCEDHPG